MSKLSVSVAIAVYNSTQYMKPQLDSILAQTRLPDEVVFVDDCSTDATVAELEKWKAQAPFDVRIVCNEQNLGCTKNFSKALGLCTKDVVIVSDCDDVWEPDRIETCLNRFESDSDLGLITGNAKLIDGAGEFLNMYLDEYLTRMHVREFWRYFYPLKSPMTVWTGCTMAVRKSVLDSVLPVPDQLACHDIWIYLLAPLCGKVEYVNQPLISYRLHGKNYSTAPTVEQLRNNPPKWRYFNTVIDTLATHPMLIESLIDRAKALPQSAGYVKQLERQKRQFDARRTIQTNALTGFGSLLKELVLPGGYFCHAQPVRSVLYDLIEGLGLRKRK